MARLRLVSTAELVLCALTVAGCGGGMPLLHPAHTLRQGQVSGAVGASGHFVLGDLDQAMTDADAAGVGNASDPEATSRNSAGIAASVLGAPGVAPFVGARVGVAERTEAGLGYTGRSARLDGRHAFENKKYALSLGLGAHALLSHSTADPAEGPATSGSLGGVDTGAVNGYGFDVPILVGYRSDADLVQLWAGLRGSYEHVFGDVLYADAAATLHTAKLNGNGFSAQGIVGLAVGLSPIWVAAEISAGYLHVNGTLEPDDAAAQDAELGGMTLTPAGALIARF